MEAFHLACSAALAEASSSALRCAAYLCNGPLPRVRPLEARQKVGGGESEEERWSVMW